MRTFDAVQRAARRRYWTGVVEAQLGTPKSRASVPDASYRLGVYHVVEGVIPRVPIAAVHDGPQFREGHDPVDERYDWKACGAMRDV